MLLLTTLVMLTLLASPVYADIDFDGIDDFVADAALCTNVITAANATFTAWIRNLNQPGTIGNGCHLNSTVIRDTNRVNSLGIKNTTQWCASNSDGTTDELLATFTTGWHSLISRHTGGTFALFVDGVSVASIASGNNLCTSAETFRFGSSMNNRIAGIMIFPVALSDEEINAFAKRRQLGPLKTMPALDVRFDDCPDGVSADGRTLVDRSGNNNNGTGDNVAEGAGVGMLCRASEYFRREWGPQ